VYAGHAAIATLVSGKRPQIPIAILVPIAFAPDWIQWTLDLAGAGQTSVFLSHSLVAVAVLAVLCALIYRWRSGSATDAIIVGLTLASHWPLDFITGTKPTWPGGPSVGLMLYSHLGYDAAVESLLVLLCWLVYRSSLTAESRRSWMVWAMPVGLIAMQIFFRAVQEPRFTLFL
jgi:hypothetical protein